MLYLITSTEVFGRLAQLVRAPALQAGGHRFESYIAHHAEMAQLVDRGRQPAGDFSHIFILLFRGSQGPRPLSPMHPLCMLIVNRRPSPCQLRGRFWQGFAPVLHG